MKKSKEILNSGTRKYTDIEVKKNRDWVSDLVLIEIQYVDGHMSNRDNQVCVNIKNVA